MKGDWKDRVAVRSGAGIDVTMKILGKEDDDLGGGDVLVILSSWCF